MPDARQKRGIRRTVGILLVLITAIVVLVLVRQFILPAESGTATVVPGTPGMAVLIQAPTITQAPPYDHRRLPTGA